VPVRRPASRIAASRRAEPGSGAAISVTPGRARCRAGVRQVAVVRAAEPGQGELGGFQFAEGGLQGGRDGQAGDRGGAGAGQQPGGVGGRDDHGGQPRAAGRGLGEQGGEDRAGGRPGAGAGQAEAAKGRDVDADCGLGVVAADADRDRAGRQLAPGRELRSRLAPRHSASSTRSQVPAPDQRRCRLRRSSSPEPLRQVPPRATRPGPEDDPVDHQPVIIPPMRLPRMGRQQRPRPCPLRITEIMPPQPLIL
jgi:hypothetical protein